MSAMRARPFALLLVLPLLVACGGKTDDLPAEADDASSAGDGGGPGDGGGGTSDGSSGADGATPTDDTAVTPGTDGGGSDGGSPVIDAGAPVDAGALTVSEACDKIAATTCGAGFKSCCESSGFKFDPFACGDGSRYWCRQQAGAVTAGTATFNPEWAEACAKGWSIGTTLCTPHLFDWIKAIAPCSQLFNGKAAPGAACSFDADCKAQVGQAVYCDGASKRCRAIAVVGEGQPCSYFGAAVRFCDKGLTCATDASGINTCIKSTPVGGACFGVDDTACGIGFACAANKCAPGLAPGAACTKDLECASWSCQSGKCTDIRQFIASKPFCGG
jgi:hypothetical protein